MGWSSKFLRAKKNKPSSDESNGESSSNPSDTVNDKKKKRKDEKKKKKKGNVIQGSSSTQKNDGSGSQTSSTRNHQTSSNHQTSPRTHTSFPVGTPKRKGKRKPQTPSPSQRNRRRGSQTSSPSQKNKDQTASPEREKDTQKISTNSPFGKFDFSVFGTQTQTQTQPTGPPIDWSPTPQPSSSAGKDKGKEKESGRVSPEPSTPTRPPGKAKKQDTEVCTPPNQIGTRALTSSSITPTRPSTRSHRPDTPAPVPAGRLLFHKENRPSESDPKNRKGVIGGKIAELRADASREAHVDQSPTTKKLTKTNHLTAVKTKTLSNMDGETKAKEEEKMLRDEKQKEAAKRTSGAQEDVEESGNSSSDLTPIFEETASSSMTSGSTPGSDNVHSSEHTGGTEFTPIRLLTFAEALTSPGKTPRRTERGERSRQKTEEVKEERKEEVTAVSEENAQPQEVEVEEQNREPEVVEIGAGGHDSDPDDSEDGEDGDSRDPDVVGRPNRDDPFVSDGDSDSSDEGDSDNEGSDASDSGSDASDSGSDARDSNDEPMTQILVPTRDLALILDMPCPRPRGHRRTASDPGLISGATNTGAATVKENTPIAQDVLAQAIPAAAKRLEAAVDGIQATVDREAERLDIEDIRATVDQLAADMRAAGNLDERFTWMQQSLETVMYFATCLGVGVAKSLDEHDRRIAGAVASIQDRQQDSEDRVAAVVQQLRDAVTSVAHVANTSIRDTQVAAARAVSSVTHRAVGEIGTVQATAVGEIGRVQDIASTALVTVRDRVVEEIEVASTAVITVRDGATGAVNTSTTTAASSAIEDLSLKACISIHQTQRHGIGSSTTTTEEARTNHLNKRHIEPTNDLERAELRLVKKHCAYTEVHLDPKLAWYDDGLLSSTVALDEELKGIMDEMVLQDYTDLRGLEWVHTTSSQRYDFKRSMVDETISRFTARKNWLERHAREQQELVAHLWVDGHDQRAMKQYFGRMEMLYERLILAIRKLEESKQSADFKRNEAVSVYESVVHLRQVAV